MQEKQIAVNKNKEHSNECQEFRYQHLIEKYEALLKVQQNAPQRRRSSIIFNENKISETAVDVYARPSLLEELKMSDELNASSCTTIDDEKIFNSKDKIMECQQPKLQSNSSINFSKIQILSSEFDDKNNKSTQTEGRPGSFLCSIADSNDCRFSIYDDTSTLECRFQQTPEYRKLFSEIFRVLKQAAKAKDDSTMDLLEKQQSSSLIEGDTFFFDDAVNSEITDDTNSVVSLSISSVTSEPIFRVHTPLFSCPDFDNSHQQVQQELKNISQSGEKILEYSSEQEEKKNLGNRRTRRNNRKVTAFQPPRKDTTMNPQIFQFQSRGGSRHKFRPLPALDKMTWNGNTTHFYPSKSARATQPYQQQQKNPQDEKQISHGHYKPGSASKEVAKLFKLEKSYADVCRMTNKSKKN